MMQEMITFLPMNKSIKVHPGTTLLQGASGWCSNINPVRWQSGMSDVQS